MEASSLKGTMAVRLASPVDHMAQPPAMLDACILSLHKSHDTPTTFGKGARA